MNTPKTKAELEISEYENRTVVTPQGFTIARLREVFNKVADPTNWKHPINATILVSEATPDEVREAVRFFAGCSPEVHRIKTQVRPAGGLVMFEAEALHVTAVGYYAAVGA